MTRIVPAALVNERGGPVVVEEVTVAPPGPGEVLVRIQASGLCHTDLIASRDAPLFPVVLGHEGAGVIEEVGDGVTSLTPSTRVVLSWKTPCGRCPSCLRGRQPWCERPEATAGPRVHRRRDGAAVVPYLRLGTFCPYVVVPADAAIAVPPALPVAEAALIGCGVTTGLGAALRDGGIQPGMDVAVFGLGGVGLNVVQGAALARAGSIIAVDRIAAKVELAGRFGATAGVLADADVVSRVREMTDGRGVDVAFEAVGVPEVMEQALNVLAPGGTLVSLGAPARDAVFAFAPRHHLTTLVQTIRGSMYGACRPPIDFPLYARWALDGTLQLGALISRTIHSLDDVGAALLALRTGEHLRTVLVFPEDP